MTVHVFFILITGFITVSYASRNSTGLSAISDCICLGYSATYECNVSGLGSTIWTGTAFSNCPNNRIVLRHTQFSSPAGTTGACNSGAIVGQSVGVQDTDCYISQLNVSVTTDVIGSTIVCSHNDGSRETEVGRSTLSITTDPVSPPTNVMLTSINSTQLIFSWNPVTRTNCRAVKYIILAENCGSCPVKSNTTTAICTNPEPQPNPGTTCSFRVQTEICEGVVGSASDTFIARLRVPDIPVITAIPTYSQSNKTLIRISVMIMETTTFIISNGTNGSTISYKITYINSTSGDICDSTVIPASACTNGICNSVFALLSLCPSTGLSITALATNILGDGEASDEIVVDQSNNFVDVDYDSNTRSIICAFRDMEDESEKSCSVTYGVCGQQEVRTIQGNSTGYQVILELDDLQDTHYCYVATISISATFIINVDGRIELGPASGPSAPNTGAIVGGVIGGFIIAVGIGVALLVIIVYIKLRARDGESYESVKDGRFELLTVEKDCELADFIHQKQLVYQRGAVFYEFTRPKEDINPDKEVILMENNLENDTYKFYTGEKARKRIRAPGKDISTPRIPGYVVFVQSMGIGRRPLEAGSHILYDRQANPLQRSEKIKETVDENHFTRIEVGSEGGPLRQILERENLQFKPGCTFFEFINKQEDIDEKKKVIIMDKETGEMFTGPAAHSEIGAPGRDIDNPNFSDKRVFIQSLYMGNRFIHKNTLLLYKDPGADTSESLDEVKKERFRIYNVKEDSNLRSFVEDECHLHYEPRRFFFEFFSDVEDISEDKEIILMERGTSEMYTGIKAKNMIGAPADRVTKPTKVLKKYRVFIQNGGAGTQYLKAGTIVLYEEIYDF